MGGSFVRFLVVGVSNTIISYLVFISMYSIIAPQNTLLSQTASYTAGILWSFFWNRRWTFGSRKNPIRELTYFVTVQLIMLALSLGLLHVAIDGRGYHVSASWIGVMAFVTLCNYFALRFLVFK